jgi:hypothetical protein
MSEQQTPPHDGASEYDEDECVCGEPELDCAHNFASDYYTHGFVRARDYRAKQEQEQEQEPQP